MAEYLVCYDHGQGGVWLYLEAASKSELADQYPALIVLDAPPDWWTPELDAKARQKKQRDPFWQAWLAALPGRS